MLKVEEVGDNTCCTVLYWEQPFQSLLVHCSYRLQSCITSGASAVLYSGAANA